MQPIGRSAHHNEQETGGALEGSGGFVLPRQFRKPVRQVRRLLSGGFHVTRKGLGMSAVAFIVLAGATGMYAAGGNEAVMSRLAPGLGIAIKSFDISGNREVSEIEIARLVSPGRSNSILNFNVDEARKALKRHPWISEARVSRVYPDKLAIEVTERRPFALWQSETGLQLIDREGNVLAAYDGRENSLPLLVGKGAEVKAADFVDIMGRYPGIASQAQAYIKVGERRWDVELENGVTIMLPEKNIDRELSRLAELDREQELLSRDVTRIDLRFEGRTIVRLAPGAKEMIDDKRQEQLKQLASSKKERNT